MTRNELIVVITSRSLYSGLSSIVRKCISRESGQEFAVKIIDKSQGDAIKESIDAEVEVLRYLPPHPNISKDS